MLQLCAIHKAYTTGTFTQVALDSVSIAFRDSEFVAILGPSGSGKTTLLNIIGGLDHYDSGDLLVDDVSTKQYRDHDWDTYRNNRVGFVFQSYNLIPHQTVLANVELALTLSGVSRAERRERAQEALSRVGLAEHINKKPSQLSGGQMQRVAIARALINDPEILLADEPTGALDSKTSVQIMDLLTEIAHDRLVVMVTHNPELAEQYATRIVNLADGRITSDSDPYEPRLDEASTNDKQIRRTSMNFLTALSLSANNLLTKKGRTFMTAFAGSIGIIGIAAILSLANGVNNYIASVEEDTLSEYPLSIEDQGFDMTSLMTMSVDLAEGETDGTDGEGAGAASDGSAADGEGGTAASDGSTADGEGASDSSSTNGTSGNSSSTASGSIREAKMVSGMFGSIGSNDLASLKEYFDSGDSGIQEYVNSIEYGYSVTPQIYLQNDDGSVRQVNPDTSFSAMGLGSSTSTSGIMSSVMSTDIFYEMPSDTTLVEEQYDVVAGTWPQNYDEVVVVLTSNGYLSDFMLYSMGLRDASELDEMVRQFANDEEVSVPDDVMTLSYDDVLGIEFKLVNATGYYEYDSDYGVYKDKSDDDEFVQTLVGNGEKLHVCGIVQPKPEASIASLSTGIYYTRALVDHLIDEAAETQIVQDQLANPQINVISGKSFLEEEDASDESSFDISSLFTIDGEKIQAAFTIDESALSEGLSGSDLSSSLDLSGMDLDMSSLPAFDASSLSTSFDISSLDLSQLNLDFSGIDIELDGAQPTVDVQSIAVGLSSVMEGFWSWYSEHSTEYADVQTALSAYMESDEVQSSLQQTVAGAIDFSDIQSQISQQIQEQLQTQIGVQITSQVLPALMQAISEQLTLQLSTAVQSYMQTALETIMTQMTSAIQTQISSAMEQMTSQITTNMASALSINEDAFADAFEMDMDEEELTELMMSLMTSEESSYEGNLEKFGYADYDKPASIDIYPKDFESKQAVIDILDNYNERMEAAGEDDKVVSYTDIVGALMTSVTDIINMISYVLVAFVAISLVVSSIMIGVITYISVLERIKEIGILRSIGASKRDIARVFNAETVIVGLAAGLIGIGVTALACIPANAIVYSLFDVPNVAILPWQAAVVLVGISVLLTFLSGLIPSRAASRKDPVEALRSE